MTYYSTGKSPYLKGRGKPIEAEGITAELLLKKGAIVQFLDELDGCPKAEVVIEPDNETIAPAKQNLEVVAEKQKRAKRDSLKKKPKQAKKKTKSTKTEKAG